jgi:glutamyl-tRNA reductase
MAQQTAVEWLQSEWQKKDIDISIRDLWKQAKEMEKEQINKAYANGANDRLHNRISEYYNETFNK